ncbi:hypothetical protein [Tateyamaria sp.]|uniref:hypothetical protein n=1 Tax=Tateyamaria sp. TaxID=1929288 RepID=UPI00329FCAFA
MRPRFFALIAVFSLAATTLSAQYSGCGDAQTPCDVEGGTFHMAMPKAEVAKGIVIHLHGAGARASGLLKSGLARAAMSSLRQKAITPTRALCAIGRCVRMGRLLNGMMLCFYVLFWRMCVGKQD